MISHGPMGIGTVADGASVFPEEEPTALIKSGVHSLWVTFHGPLGHLFSPVKGRDYKVVSDVFTQTGCRGFAKSGC